MNDTRASAHNERVVLERDIINSPQNLPQDMQLCVLNGDLIW